MDQLKIGSTLSKNLLDLIMGPSKFYTILPNEYVYGTLQSPQRNRANSL